MGLIAASKISVFAGLLYFWDLAKNPPKPELFTEAEFFNEPSWRFEPILDVVLKPFDTPPAWGLKAQARAL